MEKRLIFLLCVIIFAVGFFTEPGITGYVGRGLYSPSIKQTYGLTAYDPPVPAEPTGVIQEVFLRAKRGQFVPEEIIVGVGDTVKLTIASFGNNIGVHIEGYGIREKVAWGEFKVIEFVANKKGVFRIKPWPEKARYKKMRALLIVE